MFAARTHPFGLLSLFVAAFLAAPGCADPECDLTLSMVGQVSGHAPFGAQLDFGATTCEGETIADLETASVTVAGPAGLSLDNASVALVGYGSGADRRYSIGVCAPDGAPEGTYTLTARHTAGTGTLLFKLSGAFDGSACAPAAVATCGANCGQPDCGSTTGCCERISCGAAECGDDGCGLSCGACGVGESCNPAGKCTQPFAIASGEQDPRGITSDAYNLYWTLDSGSAVKRSTKEGGDIQVLANVPAWRVEVDARDVFWTAHTTGEIMKAAKDGSDVDANGAPAPVVLASGQQDPRGIAVDGTHVYWTDVSADAVRRVAKDGGAVQDVAGKQSSPRDIAERGDYVYWTNSASGTVLEDGSVHRALKVGGAVEVVAAGLNAPWALYVDDTHVYWTSYTEQGAVLRAPIAGGDPVVLAQGFANPRDIAGYNDSIYWLSVGTASGSGEFIGGAVYTLRKDLSGGATLGAGQRWLGALVVDGTGIYWTQAGTLQGFFADGRIMGAFK